MYGVVWKFTPKGGQALRLMAHPESLEGLDTPEKAKEDGRQTLTDLDPIYKEAMMPLAVVEISEIMVEAIGACNLIEIEELMFVVVDDLDIWSGNDWWSH